MFQFLICFSMVLYLISSLYLLPTLHLLLCTSLFLHLCSLSRLLFDARCRCRRHICLLRMCYILLFVLFFIVLQFSNLIPYSSYLFLYFSVHTLSLCSLLFFRSLISFHISLNSCLFLLSHFFSLPSLNANIWSNRAKKAP